MPRRLRFRRPGNAERLGELAAAAARYGLTALDDARVRAFLRQLAAGGLAQLDLARLAGQALDALTEDGRHQALLDELLAQLARATQGEAVQEQITEAIARELRTLRYVGLDQVAARAATRRIVAAASRTFGELADEPAHPLRQRFDHLVREFAARLKTDAALGARLAALADELMAHPRLVDYVDALAGRLTRWLRRDLAQPRGALRRRITRLAAGLGRRLGQDAAMRRWINEQMLAAAPRAIENYREDIRRHVVQRVAEWDAHEMSDELERHIGRDLQFIRINGTLVGGLVGLSIHALTQLLRAVP